MRLESMDEAGIARACSAIAGPGVQIERDMPTATREARANPTTSWRAKSRSGPTAIPASLILPCRTRAAAADELERCMRELKFCGAMINGHTNGQYLDHPSLSPFWERAEALGAPIYIHPADPVAPSPALEGVAGLRRATWEWGFETGSHALRLVFGGHFDRFPRAKVVLGHLGETLPYLLWRFDSRAKLYGIKLCREPSRLHQEQHRGDDVRACARRSRSICAHRGARDRAASCSPPTIRSKSAEEAGEFMDDVPLAEPLRADIAFNNAAKYFNLPTSS